MTTVTSWEFVGITCERPLIQFFIHDFCHITCHRVTYEFIHDGDIG